MNRFFYCLLFTTQFVSAQKLKKADKIVVMERGKIIQTGTHAELLEKGGTYKKLYELQFAEEEETIENIKS